MRTITEIQEQLEEYITDLSKLEMEHDVILAQISSTQHAIEHLEREIQLIQDRNSRYNDTQIEF